jgi:hypothetical protein
MAIAHDNPVAGLARGTASRKKQEEGRLCRALVGATQSWASYFLTAWLFARLSESPYGF